MPKNKCTCGIPLPDHLLGLTDKPLSHVCTCNLRWKEASGKKWIADGSEPNPFNTSRTQKLS